MNVNAEMDLLSKWEIEKGDCSKKFILLKGNFENGSTLLNSQLFPNLEIEHFSI